MVARIRLLHNYGGKLTGEVRVEPGDYDADDPAIFNLAAYLVKNGHAKLISGTPEELAGIPAPAPVQPAPAEDLPTIEDVAREQREIELGAPAEDEAKSKNAPKSKNG